MARKKTTSKKPGRSAATKRRQLFLPYPALIFVLLCVGVLLVGWTLRVVAGTLISATIDAPFPTVAAKILSPGDGTHFSASTLTVSGSCPDNSYVDLYDNEIFSGSAICAAGNTFAITTDLFIGANSLQTRVFNFTNNEGPKLDPISITYDPPVNPATGTAPTQAQASFVLNMDQDFQYTGYYVGKTVQLQLVAGGGTPPYVIDIDWGDGDPEIVRYQDGPFTASHTYSQPGEYLNSHTIKIVSHDASGQQKVLQIFVIVNANPAAAAAGSSASNSTKPPAKKGISNVRFSEITSDLGENHKWLLVAWPSYLIVVLMSASYLLGEREELLVLRRRSRARRR